MRAFTRWAVLLLLIVLPTFGFAQDQEPAAGQDQAAAGDAMRRMSELVGTEISLASGDLQGSVHDIVISADGSLTHLVADVTQAPAAVQPGAAGDQAQAPAPQPGTEPGVAAAPESNRFIVPVDRFTFGAKGEAVSLSMGWDDLQGFPTLEDNQLPADLSAAATAGEPAAQPEGEAAQAEQGAEEAAPDQAAAAGAGMHYLGNVLKGYRFIDSAGEEVGGVEDIMLDLQQHKVAYFGLASGGFLGIGEKLIAVPMDSIASINTEEKQLVVKVSKEQLEGMEGFDKGNWPSQAAALGGSVPSQEETGPTEEQQPQTQSY